MLLKKVSNGNRFIHFVQKPGDIPVEPQDATNQGIHGGVEQIPALGKESVDGSGTVLHPGRFAGIAETHGSWLCCYSQFLKQASKVWVVLVVKDDKASIDPMASSGMNGVSMPTDSLIRFEDGHFMMWVEKVCTNKSGYS